MSTITITIKPEQLVAGVAGACTTCSEMVTVYADPEGMWVECACDSGYAWRAIHVTIPSDEI